MSIGVAVAVLLWLAGPAVFLLWLDRVEDRADAAAREEREAEVRHAQAVAAECRSFTRWEQELAA